MRTQFILLVLLITTLLACEKDDSLLLYPSQNPNFSTISIDSPMDTLSVDFGTEFTFTPQVEQEIEKELQFKWVAWPLRNGVKQDSSVVGFDKTLRHTFAQNGEYALRLEAKNEDYSAIKEWLLQVRIWDEGFFVVGQDGSGNSNIAFARKLSSSDIAQGKTLSFETDLINRINPDLGIRDVVHIGKSVLTYGDPLAYVFIFSKDRIFVADANTLEVFNVIDFSGQFSGETIKKVSIDDWYSSNVMIFTDQGHTYVMNKFEQSVYHSPQFQGQFEDLVGNLITTAYSNQTISTQWVDYSTSKIWETIFYHGAGGPVNQTTGKTSPYLDDQVENPLKDYNIQSVGRMNGDITLAQSTNYFAVATHKEDPLKVRVWEYITDYAAGFSEVAVRDYTASAELSLPARQQMVPNARFGRSFYYFNGPNIYKWNPYNLAPNNQLPTNPAITLDGDKVVTTMTLSYDMRQLYVGFYDPSSGEELKGGMLIYNCADIGLNSNIAPVASFENITYKPTQILYKSFAQGTYNSVD